MAEVKSKGVIVDEIRLWAASTLDGKHGMKTLVDTYDKQWRNEKECRVDARLLTGGQERVKAVLQTGDVILVEAFKTA